MNITNPKTRLDDLLYITSEQVLAADTYGDLMDLYRYGMRRIKTERHLFHEDATDADLLHDQTLAGFFEYNMRHLPLGPADTRQEFSVMGTLFTLLSNTCYASSFIRKANEYAATLKDSSVFVDCVQLYLRHGGDQPFLSDEKSATMDEVRKLASSAVNDCVEIQRRVDSYLNRLFVRRAGGLLKAVAMQLNHGVNMLECFYDGSDIQCKLREAELVLADYINNLNSRHRLLKPSVITDPENMHTYLPCVSSSSSMSVTCLRSAVQQENLAKKMWDTYCESVGGTAIDNHALPDWETFRLDPEKRRQSDGWRKLAAMLLRKDCFDFVRCFEVTPADLGNVAISGQEAIPIILENEDLALLPEDSPNLRVAVEHQHPGPKGAVFMSYNVEKESKSLAVVTVSDFSCRFFVVKRDPAWNEFKAFGEYIPLGESQKEEDTHESEE